MQPWMTIPLARLLPDGSSCQPGSARGKTPLRPKPRAIPIWHCSRWGLPCRFCCQSRGGLLPHRFTLTTEESTKADHAMAVCSLWRFPLGFPSRALPGTDVLWSPDFPRPRCRDRGHPAIRADAALAKRLNRVNRVTPRQIQDRRHIRRRQRPHRPGPKAQTQGR